jgi:TM2 domain-containing membrane protein YozV
MPENTSAPYVFISYAHIDSNKVMYVIDAMKTRGINLWYDGGIAAGSEWPEYIAEKVMNCTKFVLFVSNSYLNSQNCKRELNFAISRKKDILTIYLEDVNLSPGMEMQLGTYQAFFRNRFSSDAAFTSALCAEQFFNECVVTSKEEKSFANEFNSSQENTPPTGGYYANPTPQASPVAPAYNTPSTFLPLKNKYVAGLLAIFLGGFGVHQFYLGKIFSGILHILFCWTGIPAFVSFIQGIILLCSSDENFQKKYKCRVK